MQDHLLNIRQLPPDILKKLDKLIINRVGDVQGASMLTRDISGYISPKKHYQFKWKSVDQDRALGLVEHEKVSPPQRNPIEATTPPKHVIITGQWIQDDLVFKPNANILGGMGSFVVHAEQPVIIPIIDATQQKLAFYNANLLSIGSTLQFDTKHNLPIVDISIGEQYVDHFLAQEKYGGGEYIEYHDQPHLWAPKSPDCAGHILLGRQDQDKLYLTGFRISFGHAVYLNPLTLHSDAYLIGEYLVVYTLTSHFSTVLFKHTNGAIKRLQFRP